MKQTNQNRKPDSNEHNLINEVLSGAIVNHQQLQAAQDLINQTIQDNEHLVENKHLIIIGESGCGKTSLYDWFSQGYSNRQEEDLELGRRLDAPCLIASVPSPVTPKAMSISLLKAIGDRTGLNQTSHQLTERLIHHINHGNIETIFLDEIQHLMSLGIKRKQQIPSTKLRESMDWVKSLTNKTNATYILMGMPEILDIIQSDDQLARRFTNTIYLEPFAAPSKEETAFVSFVDDLLLTASDLPFFDELEYFRDNENDALRLYHASRGVPSNIKALVIDAAIIAHSKQCHTIKMAHFARAYENKNRAALLVKQAAKKRQESKLSKYQNSLDNLSNPFTDKIDKVRQRVLALGV